MADENSKALSDLTKSMKDSNKLASENLEIQKKRQVEEREAAKALQKSNDEIAKDNKKTANDSINKTKEFWKHYTVEAEKQLIATKDAEKKGTKVLEELSKTSKAQLAQGEKGLEEKQDDKKAVKAAADEGKKQTSLLSGIFGKSKDAIKDNPVFGFLKKHWGKLLLGFGAAMLLFKTPIKDLVIGFKKVVGFLSKLTPTKIALAIATAIAAKKALDVGGDVLKDTVKFALLKKLLTRGGTQVAATAATAATATSATTAAAATSTTASGTTLMTAVKTAIKAGLKGGMASPAAIVIAAGNAIWNGIAGFFKAEEWGVGKISASLGGFMAGDADKGAWNVVNTMGQYAVAGATLGSVVPGIGTLVGGIAGGIFGAVMGFIGGQKIAQSLEALGNNLAALWTDMVETPMLIFCDDFKSTVIKPFMDSVSPTIKFIGDKIRPPIKKMKAWGEGLVKTIVKLIDYIKGLDVFTTISNFLGGTDEENEKKLEDSKKNKENSERSQEERRAQAKLEREEKDKQDLRNNIKKLEERIARSKADPDEKSNWGKGEYWGDEESGRADSQKKIMEAKKKLKSLGGSLAAPVTTDSDSGLTSTPATVNKTEMKNTPIPNDGGTTNMDGVNWDKMGGRDAVESEIWNIYNKHGKKPTFVSGLRDKNHALYNPNSQHAYGLGFDLRSKGLGSAKSAISSDLSNTFNRKGWFMQEEMAGQANSTGTRATGEHFHVHKAAKGFHGWVNEATGFIAGEAGKERIDITPMSASQPQDRMHGLNELQNQNLDAKQQASAPIIISPTQVSTVNNSNSGSTNVIGASGAGNPSRIDQR